VIQGHADEPGEGTPTRNELHEKSDRDRRNSIVPELLLIKKPSPAVRVSLANEKNAVITKKNGEIFLKSSYIQSLQQPPYHTG
jgi:hypothetical protein